MKSYLFFGPPGSGKGTQRDLVESLLTERKSEWVSIETGQLLRDHVKSSDTMITRRLGDVMSQGGLVPSAFPITMWVNALTKTTASFEHIVIDGAGRKPLEAQILVELLLFLEGMHVNIFLLDVPDDEVIKRLLKRGREDDREEVIRDRIALYNDEIEGTAASIKYLRDHEHVHFCDIDGVGTVEEVHERVKPFITI
ncbi:MAG: nucleoside monophosphate kinase [Candidatus Kaiserbacteria bacterium]|nr:nucleoside monophosphate kinase [Candidatus Kaiserbacteria bacterium]